MKKEELRVIPKKNYAILVTIIVVTLLILYYFYMWFDAYKESKINMPILDKYMDVVNYNELDNYLIENPDSVVYASVLENEEIRNFEKKVKASYKNNKISRDILYLNLTDYLNDGKSTFDKYYFEDLSILDVPCVIVFDEGKIVDIYDVKNTEYDIDNFIEYVNDITFGGVDPNA